MNADQTREELGDITCQTCGQSVLDGTGVHWFNLGHFPKIGTEVVPFVGVRRRIPWTYDSRREQ